MHSVTPCHGSPPSELPASHRHSPALSPTARLARHPLPLSAFRDDFLLDLGSLIEEVVVGCGPCGELRYPSYPEANGWRFPVSASPCSACCSGTSPFCIGWCANGGLRWHHPSLGPVGSRVPRH